MKKNTALALLLLLSGCTKSTYDNHYASFCDSEILPMGRDTFMADSECGSEYELRHAGMTCARKGKEVLVKNVDYSNGGNVIFQCLSSDDNDYQRPTYEKTPDVVIKVQ